MDTRVKPAYDAEYAGAPRIKFLIYKFKQPRARVPAPPRELGF
jgi:hypothetical protein